MIMDEFSRPDQLRFYGCGPSDALEPPPEDISTGWSLDAFSGVIRIGTSFYDVLLDEDPPPTGTGVKELGGAYGEWCAVLRRDGRHGTEYLVVADPNGFYPVFFGQVKSHGALVLVAGSTLGSCVEGMRSLGHRTQPDWDLYFSHLLSTNGLLNTVATNSTFAKGVELLQVGQALYVGPRRTAVVERARALGTESLTGYEQLVAAGVDHASNLINASLSGSFGSAQQTLSGGIDSRVVLSCALAAGTADRFSVVTHGPEFRADAWAQKGLAADLRTATEIVAEFGLKWHDEEQKCWGRAGWGDAVAYHRAFRSGYNYEMSIGGVRSANLSTSVVLRGGGGEILRSDMRTAQGAERTAERVGYHLMDRKAAAAMAEVFTRCGPELRSFGLTLPSAFEDALYSKESTLRLAADRWFSNYRSRAHFGHLRASLRLPNELTLHPLAVPEFKMAAEMLSDEDRSSGALCFDIIEMTCPRLNEISFDRGHWHDKVASRRRSGGTAAAPRAGVDVAASAAKWKQAQAAIAAQRKTQRMGSEWWGRAPHAVADVPESWPDRTKLELRESLHAVVLASGVSPSIVEVVVKMVEEGRIGLRQSLGKTLDIAQVVGLLPAEACNTRAFRIKGSPSESLPRDF